MIRNIVGSVATALLSTAGAVTVTGCNALYFYEQGKVSLAIEARPDASQPVQGSLGFKQRTAIVVPPMENGESSAMLSTFRFGRQGGFPGTIDIRTALVTGAAIPFGEGAQQAVAQAITGNFSCSPLCECLAAWTKNSQTNLQALQTWMIAHQLPAEPVMFIYAGDSFGEGLRQQAKNDLNITCN